jgi:hypothetical protein
MAEKRTFSCSICVKINAKTVAKFECFPAEQWPKGTPGLFRIRRNRAWLGDERRFLPPERIGQAVAEACFGPAAAPQPRPELPRRSWVRAPNAGPDADYDRTRTLTEPIQAMDGRWYVAVTLYGTGMVMVPVDSLIILDTRSGL